MKTTDARSLSSEAQEAIRIRGLEAVLGGMSIIETARVFKVSRKAVGNWVRAWKSNGLRALKAKPRGPKKKQGLLKGHQAALVVRLITDKCPDQVKLSHALWTRKAVQELLIERFELKVSLSTVGRLLKRWGMSPQKPLRRAFEKNPKAVKHWLDEEYPQIQKRAKKQKAMIFWGDEMGIRSDHQAGRSFGKKGQTPVIPNTGKRFGFNMISAINNRGSMNFKIFEGSFNVTVFINFMRRMIRQRKEKVFLILDNLKVHHSKKARAWVEKHHEEIELFFCLPTARN